MSDLFHKVVLVVIIPLSVLGYNHHFNQNQLQTEQLNKTNNNYVGYTERYSVKTFIYANKSTETPEEHERNENY